MAKALASQGLVNTGPSASLGSRGTPRRLGMRRPCGLGLFLPDVDMLLTSPHVLTLRGIHVIVPQIDIDTVLGRHLAPPQGMGCKAYTVDMLRLGATAVGIRIGKDKHAVIVVDNAMLTAYIARQPSVPGRIDVPHYNTVAGFEPRRNLDIDTCGAASGHRRWDHVRSEDSH